jgi:hypothetical protein
MDIKPYKGSQTETGGNHAKFLSTDQVVAMFPFLNRGTLANLRSRREGAKFYRVGRKVVYLLSDIEAWLLSQPVRTGDSLPTKS